MSLEHTRMWFNSIEANGVHWTVVSLPPEFNDNYYQHYKEAYEKLTQEEKEVFNEQFEKRDDYEQS